MPLIEVSDLDRPPRDSNVNFKIEFHTQSGTPQRISAPAEDLLDCDAASTCASESESVVLFDELSQELTFVCGSSVIFRNLKPGVLAEDIRRVIGSFGIIATVHCPSFILNGDTHDANIREFNFGFASVALSSPDEASLLNFLLLSTGLDDLSFKDGSISTAASRDIQPEVFFDDSLATRSSISVELLRDSDVITSETAELIIREYLSKNGLILTSLEIISVISSGFRAICQVIGLSDQLDRFDTYSDGIKIIMNPTV